MKKLRIVNVLIITFKELPGKCMTAAEIISGKQGRQVFKGKIMKDLLCQLRTLEFIFIVMGGHWCF